jgi:hypothetical protein
MMTLTFAVSETARGRSCSGRLRAHRRVVVKAEHGHARAEDVHRVRVLGRVLEEIDDRRGQLARSAQVGLQLLELCLVRQLLVPEQVNNFLVADLACQLVDVVSGVNQDALFTHDIAKTRGGGDDPLQVQAR